MHADEVNTDVFLVRRLLAVLFPLGTELLITRSSLAVRTSPSTTWALIYGESRQAFRRAPAVDADICEAVMLSPRR